MATAKKTESVTTVTLTLSPEEAGAIAFVAGRIGGPDDGPRGIYDNIGLALERVVVVPNWEPLLTDGYAGVFFKSWGERE